MFKTKKITFLVFASILLLVFVTLPVFQNFLEAHQEVKIKRNEFNREEEKINELKKINQQISDYPEQIELVLQAIPDNPEVPSTVYHIQEIAEKNNVLISGLNNFSTNTSLSVKETTLSFSLYSFYGNFKNFISDIENSAKMIHVESFEIKSDKDSDILSINLIIKTYSY